MKETPIFEEVFMRFFRQKELVVKLLIGGVLSFLPIVNLFAFGYLYRFSASVRRTGSVSLPEWADWKVLFIDGLRFAVPCLAFWFLPVLLVTVLSGVVGALGLGALAYLLFTAVLFVAPVLFSAALYRLQMRQDFKDLLNLPLIFKMAYAFLPRMLIPAFVLLGIGTLLLPLYGFAFFIAYSLLIAHTTLCYREAERPTF